MMNSPTELTRWFAKGTPLPRSTVTCTSRILTALLKTEIKEGFFPPEGQGGGGYRITGLVSVTVEDAIEEIREGTNNGDL